MESPRLPLCTLHGVSEGCFGVFKYVYTGTFSTVAQQSLHQLACDKHDMRMHVRYRDPNACSQPRYSDRVVSIIQNVDGIVEPLQASESTR